MLLKRCVECGLAPTEIAAVVTREWFKEPTHFELMVAEALGVEVPTEHTFYEHDGDLTLVNYVKGVVKQKQQQQEEEEGNGEGNEEGNEQGNEEGNEQGNEQGNGGHGDGVGGDGFDPRVAMQVEEHRGTVQDGWFVPDETFFQRFAQCLEREFKLPAIAGDTDTDTDTDTAGSDAAATAAGGVRIATNDTHGTPQQHSKQQDGGDEGTGGCIAVQAAAAAAAEGGMPLTRSNAVRGPEGVQGVQGGMPLTRT